MARQEANDKASMHIPLGRAVIIGALLLFIHPAASYVQEWRQAQTEQHRQITLQLIETALSERDMSPQAFSAGEPQEVGLLRNSHSDLAARVQAMDEQVSELSDRVSKLNSRLISLAESSQTPVYEQLSAENFNGQ
jgi:hypothetical protein